MEVIIQNSKEEIKIAAMTKKVSRNRSSKNIFESEDKTKLIEPKHRLSLLAEFSPHQIRLNPISTMKEGNN